MKPYFQNKSIEDFRRFMNQPNLQACIVEEYNSFVSKQEEERHHGMIKKFKMTSCFPYQLIRFYDPQSNNTIIGRTSFIDGYETKRKFIRTKNPQKSDCEVFWHTVWANKVKIIVMTCQFTHTSYQYWSPKEGYVLIGKRFKVKTWQILINSHYTLTLLSLTASELKSKPERMIFHYQYTAWPRDKFSHQLDAFIDFYYFVNDTYVKLGSRRADKQFPPIMIHCLDGVGSSPVFCAFDICITQLDRTGMLSVPNAFTKIQKQKHGSINYLDLYALCYQLVEAYLDKI